MSHFAKIEDGIVTQIIVAEIDFISTLVGTWVQTSYNTQGGKHLLGGTPMRKNYAGVGYLYDEVRDAFMPPQPYPSWVLDEETCYWHAPVAEPLDGKRHAWDESTLSWIEVK